MRTLLIVEDEADIRETYETMFSPETYDVYLAANGKEATRLIHRHRFDVVVTDYRMPWVDGGELFHRIRKSKGYEETPVVFVTGYAADLPSAIVADSNVTVLEKPIDLDTLLTTVDACENTDLTNIKFKYSLLSLDISPLHYNSD